MFLSPSSGRNGKKWGLFWVCMSLRLFFRPDPGVSLHPNVVYSAPSALLIAYAVILPLKNILWLQVTNFSC